MNKFMVVMTGQAVPGWICTDHGSYVNPLAVDRYEVHKEGLTMYQEDGTPIATLAKPVTFVNALTTLRVMSKFKGEDGKDA